MALTIGDDSMTSDRSPHATRLAPGEDHLREVSWLPGWPVSRNEAITAMAPVGIAGTSGARPGGRTWGHLEARAAGPGMTAPQALARLQAASPGELPEGSRHAGRPRGRRMSRTAADAR